MIIEKIVNFYEFLALLFHQQNSSASVLFWASSTSRHHNFLLDIRSQISLQKRYFLTWRPGAHRCFIH